MTCATPEISAQSKNNKGKALSPVPAGVIFGLVLAIVLDTAVQITWKFAVLGIPEASSFWGTILCALKQPLLLAVAVLFGLQFLNWMRVLTKADLSYAQPITALSYVSVAVCSAFFLHEVINPYRAAGIALIIVGVWFISQTNHLTQREVNHD